MFRLLKEHEIECRVKKMTEKGAIVLLYKTARTDMDILDETVTPTNWESDYKEIKGNLYCGIGIRLPDGQMAWKWDCGVESREDEDGNQKKGEASDAFKRAGFKWGIGRELYTAPHIFIPNDRMNVTTNRGGKPITYDTFSVEKISFDENRNIVGICIRNDSTKKRCFIWQKQ